MAVPAVDGRYRRAIVAFACSMNRPIEWRLAQIGDGSEVASGSERSFTSYSATSTTVATSFAQRDARRRLMVILADRIVTDLLGRDIA